MADIREQTNKTQQRETTNQHDAKASAGQQATSDRERPIESGRESNQAGRSGTEIVRQTESAPPVQSTFGNPFTVMRRMAADMDRLFKQFGFGRTGPTSRFGSLLDEDLWSQPSLLTETTNWWPQVETFRRGDKLVVRADLPGVKKDDVRVQVENDELTISGERREERDEERDGFYRSERSYGRFYRALPLPEGVNAEQCDASFKDGVLEVTLPAPKQEEAKTKRIPVK